MSVHVGAARGSSTDGPRDLEWGPRERSPDPPSAADGVDHRAQLVVDLRGGGHGVGHLVA